MWMEKVGSGPRSVTSAVSEVKSTEVKASNVICCKRVTWKTVTGSSRLCCADLRFRRHTASLQHQLKSNAFSLGQARTSNMADLTNLWEWVQWTHLLRVHVFLLTPTAADTEMTSPPLMSNSYSTAVTPFSHTDSSSLRDRNILRNSSWCGNKW